MLTVCLFLLHTLGHASEKNTKMQQSRASKMSLEQTTYSQKNPTLKLKKPIQIIVSISINIFIP